MANSLTHAGLPFPVYGAFYTVTIPYLDATGTPLDPTSPDTEVSLTGGVSFTDCTNEVTAGGGNGVGHITLRPEEMAATVVILAAKSANAKTTILVLTPYVLQSLAGIAGTFIEVTDVGDASEFPIDPVGYAAYFGDPTFRSTGLWVFAESGTGIGQARLIKQYDASTNSIVVAPFLETAFDATTQISIGFPLGLGAAAENLGPHGGFAR